MLTEQRYQLILELLEKQKSITVTEVKELLDTSESTVRRDITALDKAGKLTKVFGGAIALEEQSRVTAAEPTVAQKMEVNKEEKQRIARYAAGLITDEDFVYLDAGTTTVYMLEYIPPDPHAAFVPNGVALAGRLAGIGDRVQLVGGELKGSTEAVVGNMAMKMLRVFHFTKGFFGTNGVTEEEGCTTPDANEAMVKQTAMEQCRERYVLADRTKFGQVSSVTFAAFEDVQILTEKVIETRAAR